MRQTYFLGRPQGIKNYLDHFDKYTFDDYIKDKPPELSVLYQTVLYTIIMTSVLPDPPQERIQFLFWGHPGTGKDTFINLVCNVLSTQKQEIDYKQLEMARISHYSTGANEKIASPLHTAPEVTTANPLADAVRKAGHQNPIILLPELSERIAREGMLLSVLKTMLDPNTEPHHAVIFATTNTPPADLNPALVNRFVCVQIPPPTDPERHTHARRQFNLVNSALQTNSPYTLDPDLISQLAENTDPGYRTTKRNALPLNGYLAGCILNNTQPDQADLQALFQALNAPKLRTADSDDTDSSSE